MSATRTSATAHMPLEPGIAQRPPGVPRHVAIIMDGNGRWAKKRGHPRAHGHQEGFRTTRTIVEAAATRGVEALTLFAFSSENWRRPDSEVGFLMDLFLKGLRSEVERLNRNRVCMKLIGERSAFNHRLQEEMHKAETLTQSNTGMVLSIAVNYGGRQDIVSAARHLAQQVAEGQLKPEQIDEARFAAATSLADLPEPDLFIRTGGELRISNFLLWQLAYTELWFTERLWPDFDERAFDEAIEAYGQRQRRFGQTGDQLDGEGG